MAARTATALKDAARTTLSSGVSVPCGEPPVLLGFLVVEGAGLALSGPNRRRALRC